MADMAAVQVGKELGLTGDELRMYVEQHRREEQEYERERRAHEREMKRLELEISETKLKAETQSHDEHDVKRDQHFFRGPKLPPFDESRDQIDSYLERFERYAFVQKWNNADMAVFLSALLQGKALDVYSRLSPEQSTDYEVLKDALLRAYQLTENGFRKKFFEAKPNRDETPSQFVFRLKTYIDKWIELSRTAKAFESLRQLFVREQFLSTVPRDLKVYVREHVPSDLRQTVKLTETYMEARGWKYIGTDKKPTGPMKVVGQSREEGRPLQSPSDVKYVKQFGHRDITCYRCNRVGHTARFCPEKGSYKKAAALATKSDETVASCSPLPCRHCSTVETGSVSLKCGCELPMVGSSCHSSVLKLPVSSGRVGEHSVEVMRDTGCSTVVVRRALVNDEQLTQCRQTYVMIDGTVRSAPVARVEIDTPYYTGTVDALCLDNPVYDLIVGNVPGATMGEAPPQAESNVERDETDSAIATQNSDLEAVREQQVNGVQTRSMAKRSHDMKPLRVPEVVSPIGSVTVEKLKSEQQADSSLGKLREVADKGIHETRNGTIRYNVIKGILYRFYMAADSEVQVKQLVVPVVLRETILKLGHDTVMAGHLGVAKTTERVLGNFYWPGITADVRRYVQSCDVCQKTVSRGRIPKAPVERMPLIDTPFKKVAVDLVGPIEPRSSRGNRYILTLVDYATRDPEAVALPSITTEAVAEALVQIFSRVGVPHEVLWDDGSQFTSGMMKEVCKLLSIDQVTTSPYHAMANGLVEKFNGTLKQMLRKMCTERPSDWDRYLEPLLFAYREVPQASSCMGGRFGFLPISR